MKKKIKEKDVKEIKSNVRKRSGRYQKCKGNSYERQIARELRELGFEGIKTSRSESKSTDDNKIDLLDKASLDSVFAGEIQLKKTKATPSYFTIREQTTWNNDLFCILWNKQINGNINMKSIGECAIISKNLFYKLIKNYYLNKKSYD